MAKVLRVAAAQVEVRELDICHNKKRILYFLEEAKRQEVDIVCFCEGALTGWFVGAAELTSLAGLGPAIHSAMQEVAAACGKLGINAIVGQLKPDGNQVWNEAIAWDRQGREVHIHSKRVLTPGEENAGFAVGGHYNTFDLDQTRCGIAICFEFEEYPASCEELVQKGARIIFNPKHHRSLLGEWKPCACKLVMTTTRCRAISLARPIISANRAVESKDREKFRQHPEKNQMSHSAIVDNRGLVLASSYPLIEQLLVAEISV